MIEKKQVLFVVENPKAYASDMREFEEAGYDVVAAGVGEGRGMPVDDAITRLNSGDYFDAIVSNMYMASGFDYISPEESNRGWATGKVFAEYLQDICIDTPVIFCEQSTGLVHCDNYDSSKGTVSLDSGTVVPLVILDDPRDLVQAVDLVIENNSNPPQLEDHLCL